VVHDFVDGYDTYTEKAGMVSARAWPDHPSWMREFVRILRAKAPAS
jgi:protease I